MTPLRRKRLLILANKPKGHRYFYGQYRQLEFEGLCFWQFGWAHLTDAGRAELDRLTPR